MQKAKIKIPYWKCLTREAELIDNLATYCTSIVFGLGTHTVTRLYCGTWP